MFTRLFGSSKKQKGFTLSELMVIVAIIGILAVVIYARMGSGKSNDVKRISEVNTMRDALKLYHMDHGHYPTSTVSEDWCYLEVAPGNPDACEGLYNTSGEFVLESYLNNKPGDVLFGQGLGAVDGKTYSYQYISTSSGSGYMIHTDLEERKVEGNEFYEIRGGIKGSIPSPPPPPPPVVCGDGATEGGEVCDDGNTTNCNPYPGCSADCLNREQCGDGDVECSEECDGADLDGETCISQGFTGGTLSCSGGCTFDTSACTGSGNNPPVAVNDSAAATDNVPVNINVLSNDTDPDGLGEIDPTTVTVIDNPDHGFASVNPFSGVITYLSAGYVGIDTFTYTVKDIHGAESNEATVTMTVSAASISVSFSSASYSVVEDVLGGEITITIDISEAPTDNPVSVDYSTSDDGATGGALCFGAIDYISTFGSKSWAIGDSSPKTFAITICDDSVYEGDERIGLNLFNVVNADISGANPARLTIVDDESGGSCSTCNECNAAIASASFGEMVTLQNDIWGVNGDCVNFNGKDGITFNCDNYTIGGDNDDNGYGINLPDNSDSNSIGNCRIQGFADGIVISNSASTSIKDSQSTDNTMWGLRVSNFPFPQNIVIDNFIASSNGNEGISIYGVDNSTFANVTTDSNGQSGFKIANSDNNIFTRINADNNNPDGIHISSSDNNNFSDLDLRSNLNGLYLSDSSGNTFSDSTITNNDYFDVRPFASSDTNCNNTFNNITGTNGLPIAFYNGTGVNLTNQTFSQLILCDADGAFLDNITINGSQNNGLWLARTDNANISNLNSSNNWTGVWLRFSNNNSFNSITLQGNPSGFGFRDSSSNTISNSTISDSWWADVSMSMVNDDTDCVNTLTNVIGTNGLPIHLYNGSPANLDHQTFSELILCDADGSTLDNITIDGAANNGLYIYRTDNSSFSNINSSENDSGLIIGDSSNNNFSYITVDNNQDSGIQLSGGGNNQFNNCLIRSNDCWGMKILSGSGNTLSSSRVEATEQWSGDYDCAGITVNDSGNTFFNNIIYNRLVPDVNSWDDPFLSNTWNVSPPQPGPNVIGGLQTGGNYWRNYDTCSDVNSDGFCDLPYDVEHGDSDCSDANNCDDLPLAI